MQNNVAAISDDSPRRMQAWAAKRDGLISKTARIFLKRVPESRVLRGDFSFQAKNTPLPPPSFCVSVNLRFCESAFL
jgi:hypothetical protein